MRKNHLYALSKIKTIEKLIRKNFFTILAVSTSFLLVLTSWNAHKINLLKPQVQISPFGPEEGKLIVTAKAYTHEESKIYLQRDLVDRGVQPLEVTIQNNTDKKYSVTASSVDLPRIDPKKVAAVLRSPKLVQTPDDSMFHFFGVDFLNSKPKNGIWSMQQAIV